MTGGLSSLTVLDLPGAGREVPFGGHSMQHGTAVFEGIRCYRADGGPAVFRLDEHLERMVASAAELGIDHPYDLGTLRSRVLDAAATSGLDACYVRPVLFAPEPRLGVDLGAFSFTLGVEVWPMPATVAAERKPLRLTVSPWRRPARASFPPTVKATGMYVVSALAKTHAVQAGFDDAIQLDPDSGRVAEATIANVFVVKHGRLATPWLEDSLLAGITRASMLELAGDIGIEAVEVPLGVDDLLDADEVFLTGTAIEMVPVAAIDGTPLPRDRPLFQTLLAAFHDCVAGRHPARARWLTHVSPATDVHSTLRTLQ